MRAARERILDGSAPWQEADMNRFLTYYFFHFLIVYVYHIMTKGVGAIRTYIRKSPCANTHYQITLGGQPST